jgi:hypothetical protein
MCRCTRLRNAAVNLDARLDAAVVGIERHLTDTYPARPGTRFNFNDAASAAHRDGRLSDRELADVRSLWEVRNLVSHRRFDGQRPVAATTAGVVLAEQLLEVLSGKMARLDVFAGKAGGVVTIAPDEPVRAALELMQMNDFTCPRAGLPRCQPAAARGRTCGRGSQTASRRRELDSWRCHRLSARGPGTGQPAAGRTVRAARALP